MLIELYQSRALAMQDWNRIACTSAHYMTYKTPR